MRHDVSRNLSCASADAPTSLSLVPSLSAGLALARKLLSQTEMNSAALRKIDDEISPWGDVRVERVRRIAELEGMAVLSDADLVALVLGRGSKGRSPFGLSHDLLETLGGLAGLSRNRLGALSERTQLGRAQRIRLLAACELGGRVLKDTTRVLPRSLLTKERVFEWAESRLCGLDHEEVWVLCVDSQCALKSSWQVGRGGIHGCGLLARDLLTPVVRDAASGFILVHNHPSGDPTPSHEDIELTKNLRSAASALCVPLLDHVIVSRGAYRSFFELGLL